MMSEAIFEEICHAYEVEEILKKRAAAMYGGYLIPTQHGQQKFYNLWSVIRIVNTLAVISRSEFMIRANCLNPPGSEGYKEFRKEIMEEYKQYHLKDDVKK